jgi:hypothetical protein
VNVPNFNIPKYEPHKPFTFDNIRFVPIESAGCYFGVGVHNGKDWLAYVAMLADGTPELYEGKPAVGEVQNFDEDQAQLDLVNRTLGTNFPMSFFPGR